MRRDVFLRHHPPSTPAEGKLHLVSSYILRSNICHRAKRRTSALRETFISALWIHEADPSARRFSRLFADPLCLSATISVTSVGVSFGSSVPLYLQLIDAPPAHGSVTLQTDWCWHVWLAACNNMWQACWGADNSVLCFGASISGEICAHLSYNESRFNLLKTEWTGLLITSRLFFSHWLALH